MQRKLITCGLFKNLSSWNWYEKHRTTKIISSYYYCSTIHIKILEKLKLQMEKITMYYKQNKKNWKKKKEKKIYPLHLKNTFFLISRISNFFKDFVFFTFQHTTYKCICTLYYNILYSSKKISSKNMLTKFTRRINVLSFLRKYVNKTHLQN